MWALAGQAACLDMSTLLPEMDSMLAWGYMQQLLPQDTPDIPDNPELHTSVQQHSVHTSENTLISHHVLVLNAMDHLVKGAFIWFCFSNLSPDNGYPN